jgi:tetratricopeptide (TPR) repeat protein
MRYILLIIIGCLLLTPACSRKPKTQGNAATTSSADKDLGVAIDPTQARVMLDQGKELYKKDDDEKAAEAFEKAAKLDPDFAEAYFRMGLAYDALGQKQQAEDSYKKAIEKYKKFLAANPKDGEGHYNMGQAYAGLHLHTEAVREYRLAAKLQPDDADIYFDLGSSLTRLAQYDEAAAAFQKCLDIDPENYRAQDALEEAREGVNRIKTARKYQEAQAKKEEEKNKDEEGNAKPSASPTKKPPTRF